MSAFIKKNNKQLHWLLALALLFWGCDTNTIDENIVAEKDDLNMAAEKKVKEWRFVPIGDSYTKGEGTTAQQSWPMVLTRHLQQGGVNITLITNPAQNGWTTQDAIELEMPEFRMARPNVAVLMIGANDVVQRVPLETFEERYALLLDSMIKELSNKDNLIVITIPDFSITPVGKAYRGEENIEEEIKKYNQVILREAKKRNVSVVDLFAPSKLMEKDPTLISEDGLHPSALGYAKFEEIIYPLMKEKLQ